MVPNKDVTSLVIGGQEDTVPPCARTHRCGVTHAAQAANFAT
jgi:hypothetical protein